jgi:hypothetical protein
MLQHFPIRPIIAPALPAKESAQTVLETLCIPIIGMWTLEAGAQDPDDSSEGQYGDESVYYARRDCLVLLLPKLLMG